MTLVTAPIVSQIDGSLEVLVPVVPIAFKHIHRVDTIFRQLRPFQLA